MAWIRIKPKNIGGGRKPPPPTGKLYESGQFTLSNTTADMLGNPSRILVSIEPEIQRIRLTPTTPNDTGGFSLSGGGNSPYRIGLKLATKTYPQMIGDYVAYRITGGVELKKDDK